MIITKEDLEELFKFKNIWDNNSKIKKIDYLKSVSNGKFMFYFAIFLSIKWSFNDLHKNYSRLVNVNESPALSDIEETLQNFFMFTLEQFDIKTFEKLTKAAPPYQPTLYSNDALEKEIKRISIRDDELIPFIERNNFNVVAPETLELFLPTEYLYCFNLLFNFPDFKGRIPDNEEGSFTKYNSEQQKKRLEISKHNFHNELTKINNSIYSLFQCYKQAEMTMYPLTLIAQADIFNSCCPLKKRTEFYEFKDLNSLKNFQLNLSNLIDRSNLSIRELAKISNIERNTIKGYLKKSQESVKIKRIILQKLATVLGVTVDFLVGKTPNPIESFDKNNHAALNIVKRVSPYQNSTEVYGDERKICRETLQLLIAKDKFLTDQDFKEIQNLIETLANNKLSHSRESESAKKS